MQRLQNNNNPTVFFTRKEFLTQGDDAYEINAWGEPARDEEYITQW